MGIGREGGGDDVTSNGHSFVPFASFVVERSGWASLGLEMGILGPKMAQIGLKSTGYGVWGDVGAGAAIGGRGGATRLLA